MSQDARGGVPPETVFDLAVPARPDRLKLVRACMAEGARAADLPEEAATDLIHAVDEACQNIIRHGYGDPADPAEPEGEIGVTFVRWADSVAVTLSDTAGPIPPEVLNPRASSDPAQGDLAQGGMGLPIIRACVDDLRAQPRPDGRGNRLTLTKRIG